MQRFFQLGAISSLLVISLFSCKNDNKRFELLDKTITNIDFVNRLTPTVDLNIFNYLYYYNGAGVGAGDFNNDSLPDLFFVSNQGLDHLYLNKGDFKFQDISDVLGELGRPNKWATGVSIVDINADGLLDIYVSEVGSYLKIEGQNRLYVNKGNDAEGIPQFEESAKDFGLDLVGFGTQTAFFDYDLDGDLDAYVLNHSVHSNGTFGKSHIRAESHPLAGDRFFKNENGKFIDVTKESKIYNSPLGYGLGITVSDINQDGYPDIYIGNDFHEDDYLYINQKDGTFKESLAEMVRHTSRFSMGNDIADINNDGLPDILSLDMLPQEYQKQKSSAGEDAYDVYQYKLKYGYKDQFARNTLQLNRGNGKFSEIGLLSGIAATDWSWSGLMADFDLDGQNDIYVANGIKGRTNDLDYINYISNEAIQSRLEGNLTEKELLLTNKMPLVIVPNYAYKNKGGLEFSNVSEEWGLDQESFSNGAIYCDLDGDGDLEIVVNNIDSEAFIYKNNTIEESENINFLRIKLEGDKNNPFGIGAKATLKVSDSVLLYKENYPVRGFESSVETGFFFGLGKDTVYQQLTITWPDGKTSNLPNNVINKTITVKYSESKIPVETSKVNSFYLAENISDSVGLKYKHSENSFTEFNRERLLPHMVSAIGPAFAKADINKDNLDDFFLGGAKHQPSWYFIQDVNGKFLEIKLPEDSVYEDVAAVFYDFDNDKDEDLLVLSGGNEFRGTSKYNTPRLYLNSGNGQLIKDTTWMPDVFLSGSVISLNDYDADGDMDVFLGARAKTWNYGMPPENFLLKNEGNRFVVDTTFSKIGKTLGMVTGALWYDMNMDRVKELVTVAEWSEISIVHYNKGSWSKETIPGSSNLWYSLNIEDLDKNGRPDIVAGGLGLNSKLAHHKKINMYVQDYDGNGAVDQIITTESEKGEFIFAEWDELVSQINELKQKYTSFEAFSKAGFAEVFSPEIMKDAIKYSVEDTRSSLFFQDDYGKYTRKPLSINMQMAPVRSIFLGDFNFDSMTDILTTGNMFRVNIQRGKYDASYGEIMLNWGSGDFKYVENSFHKLYLDGEIVDSDFLIINGAPCLIFIRNNNSPLIYKVNFGQNKY